jgi:hypothetical protein
MKTGEFPAKRLFLAIGLIVAAAIIIAVVYTSVLTVNAPQMTPANAVNIIKAARAFTHDLRASGKPMPGSVALTNLVALKYLEPADAAPFNGLEATLFLVATNNSPQTVLMRVRAPDGSQTLLLADGSSRQIPAGSPPGQ